LDIGIQQFFWYVIVSLSNCTQLQLKNAIENILL